MSSLSPERKKQLIEEYKRTPKTMGLYRILNRENGRVLIATSRDVRARLNRHQANLKTKSETNRELQADWDRFGQNAFSFETLITLEPSAKEDYDPDEDLKELETLWWQEAQLDPQCCY